MRRALECERRALVRAVAAGLLVTLSTVGLSATSAWLIVRAAQRPAVLALTVPMGLVQLFALAKAAGRYVERTQTHRAALGVMGHVRASVARLLEPLVPAGLGPRSADVVDVVLGDVERVQDLLTAVVGPLLTSVLAGLVTVVVAGVLVPSSALVLLAGLSVCALGLPLLAARLGDASETEMVEVRRAMNALFDRAASSGDEYVMAGAAHWLLEELAELEDRFDRARRQSSLTTGVVTGLTTLVSGLCVIGVVGCTAVSLRQGHLAPALVAVPALLSLTSLELVGGVVPSLVGLRGDRAAMTRLEALADVECPVREPDLSVSFARDPREVRAVDVGRDYDGSTVLAHASLELGPGDVVVLSGPSGGGKTTFARLLAKFLDPDTGAVHLGSSNYRLLSSRDVRAHVGYVDDAPHVFATTLAGNLRIAKSDASDAELRRALDLAGLGSLLATMPEGLATQLGGATTGLSGGEQRRLGLARELLVRRAIGVFDEPTEGLDEETADTVIASLIEHYRERAMLLISHRDIDHPGVTRRCELRGATLREFGVVAPVP